MYKILKGVQQLKGAISIIEEVINIIAIDIAYGSTRIHVQTLRDLEQIPGELELVERSCQYPFEARKTVEGVRFFCLLEAAEVEELRKSA